MRLHLVVMHLRGLGSAPIVVLLRLRWALTQWRWLAMVSGLFVWSPCFLFFGLLVWLVADSFPAAPLASWVSGLSCFGSGFVLAFWERPRHLWSVLSYGLAVVMSAAYADSDGLPTVTGCLLVSGTSPLTKKR